VPSLRRAPGVDGGGVLAPGVFSPGARAMLLRSNEVAAYAMPAPST